MFQLSQTHNQAFQAKAEADFVREVMQYLRENRAETIVKFPDGEFKVADLPEETLQKLVEGGIAKARSYGMTWLKEIKIYVELMFIKSPNFSEFNQISKIFSSNIIAPNWKIKTLLRRKDEINWDIVFQNYDVYSWGVNVK